MKTNLIKLYYGQRIQQRDCKDTKKILIMGDVFVPNEVAQTERKVHLSPNRIDRSRNHGNWWKLEQQQKLGTR